MSADYFGDISAWLEASGRLNDKFLSPLIGLNSGGLSKSIIFDVLKDRKTLRGADPGIIYVDTEMPFSDLFGSDLPIIDDTRLATFEDPEHPECTTFASLMKLDKRDPRNPNPQAGSVKRFFVSHKGGREQVRNKTTALARAEAIHKRLVAERKAVIAEEKRQKILAQEQAIEEARRNREHLTALPAFGGF